MAAEQFAGPGEYVVPSPGTEVPPGAAGSPVVDPENPWGPPPPGMPPCEPATGCCSYCGQGSCCPPCWYMEHGVRLLTRSRPRDQTLVRRFTLTQGLVKELGTKTEGFDISPSYTVTLGRYLGRDSHKNDWFFEASYWGLNEWEANACVNSDLDRVYPNPNGPSPEGGNLFTPFRNEVVNNVTVVSPIFSGVGGFNRVDTIEYENTQNLNNVEVNWWIRPRARADRLVLQPNGRWVRQCQPGCYVGYTFGLRAMFVEDDMALRSRGELSVGDASVPVSGDYFIDADNALLGFQVGTELMYRHCRWSWGGRFRVSPFLNMADQESRIITSATGDPFNTQNYDIFREADDEEAAVAIELGFGADYRLRPGCVARVGYDLMWVPGVALAPEQIDFDVNACPELNNEGLLFYHGLTMSLNFAW